MKKLIVAGVLMVAMLGFAGQAKADYDTLAGVADIIYATGNVVNGGYDTVVYYEPYPVYHRYYYDPYPRRYYYQYHYYPRRYYHCY